MRNNLFPLPGNIALVLYLGLSSVATTSYAETAQHQIQFQWQSSNGPSLENHRKLLLAHGGTVSEIQVREQGTKNPTAIALLLIAGVAAVSELANAIVQGVKDYQHGGLIVDMQNPEIKIIETDSLRRGQILVRKMDKEVVSFEYSRDSETNLIGLISALLASKKNR